MERVYKAVSLFAFIFFLNTGEIFSQATTPVPPPEASVGTFQCMRGSQRLQGTQYMKGNYSSQPVVKWLGQLTTTNGGCEGEPVIGDCDGDGMNEVLEPAGNGILFCFNGATGATEWTKAGVGNNMSVIIGDANNDGQMDVISVYDHVYCLNGTNGNIIWTFSPTIAAGSQINTCPNMGDLDNDGANEVVVIVNNTVYAVNGLNGTVKWQYTTGAPGTSFNGSTPAIGDLNSDGILDVVASLQNGSNAQWLVALNGNNGSLIWSIPAYSSFTGLGAPVPAIADVDGDCDLDVVYNKAAIRGDNGTVIWGNPASTTRTTYCILADLDDNCSVEVIAPCGVYHANNGSTIWQLSSCSQNGWFAPAPRVGDFSPASPGKEIVLAGAYDVNRPVTMFAGITGTQLWAFSMASLNHTAEGVSIGDIDNDGCVEIVVAPDCCNGDNTVLALDDAPNATSCGILASIGQVDFLPHDTTACNCIDFRDFSSACATGWEWTFQGGSPATYSGPNPGTVCFPSPGTYTVTMIAHLNACAAADTITHTVTICASTLSVSTITHDPPCNGGCNGNAIANPSNGTPPYTYSWSPSGQTTQTVSALCAGTYSVTITDSTGNTATTAAIINQPTPLTIAVTSVDASCSTCPDGYAWAVGGGGTPPYDYEWGTVPIQNTDTAWNLLPGSYFVCVDDANSCKRCTTIVVSYTVGIYSIAGNSGFTIYPNPVKDEFTIRGSQLIKHIEIFNVLGETVFEEQPDCISCLVNCNLPKGIYFIRVMTENGMAIKKFIKE
jgi:outer membrane protein assembly factor BamB